MAPSVTNGHYTVTHLFSSSTAALSCNPGYTPSTNGGTIQCNNNVWTQAGHCTPTPVPSCDGFSAFMAFTQSIADTCCTNGVACDGVPSTCTAACAGVLLPYQSACADTHEIRGEPQGGLGRVGLGRVGLGRLDLLTFSYILTQFT